MGRKNSVMTAKHAKAKKEAGKASAENMMALMSSGVGMAESTKWHMSHKNTDYLTPRGNAVIRQQIIDKYHEVDFEITGYIKNKTIIPRSLRHEYRSICERVRLYGLQQEVGLSN